jgi:dTDP-4-dehydrorhamnose 3,5-epimerase
MEFGIRDKKTITPRDRKRTKIVESNTKLGVLLMEFVDLAIDGVCGIIAESKKDSRGSLTRVWDKDSFVGNLKVVQSSFVLNPQKNTLRGLHYQTSPYSENKVVQCVTGKVFDVIVDLREESDTFREHLEVKLGPDETFLGVLVPIGCAHGYITLEENTSLIYFMDKEFSPGSAQGIYWNDPSLAINWPTRPDFISERDSKWQVLK